MKYRKKPVIVEAYQTEYEMDINTLEGVHHASVGDYIITGVKGEKYPCKPDIFAQTYEPVEDGTKEKIYVVEDGKVTPCSSIDYYGHKIYLNKEDAEKAAREELEDELDKHLSTIQNVMKNLKETVNKIKELK